MELEQRVKLARLIVALADDDREKVVSAYTAMGIRTKRMGEGDVLGCEDLSYTVDSLLHLIIMEG